MEDLIDKIFVVHSLESGAIRDAVATIDGGVGVELEDKWIAIFIDANLHATVIMAVENVVRIDTDFCDEGA